MAYSALSVTFLNVFIARDAGIFKKHGLEVELIQWRVVGTIRDKWKLDAKVADEVYGQWLSTLAMDGKIGPKDL